MRKQPPSPPKIDEQPKEVITLIRDYELITPLFGGGVTPGETDIVTIVRGTEIRGHLRFWWRACRGGQFSNLAEMKQRENKLWGTAYSKDAPVLSQDDMVQITVEILKRGEDVNPFGRDANTIPAYVAFPLQPKKEEQRLPNPPQRYVRKGVAFRLTISFPKTQQTEVEASLWAWETFGGVGARTRRGFGALHCLNADAKSIPSARDVEGWLRENLARYIEQEKFPEGIPHLSREMRFKVKPAQNAMQAWNNLINRLKNFRQFDRLGPHKKSLWPEARAIRQLTQGQQAARAFPRAAFGLPIIFHFIGNGPADTTLNEAGEKRERLASPLILRPLVYTYNKNDMAVGLAALLEGSRVQNNLELKEEHGRNHQVEATLTKQEASKIDVLNGQTDVLQEFLNFL